VSFDPTLGSETRRRRPAVVVSNDASNRFAPIVTVVPVTSNVEKVYPFEVLLPKRLGLARDSKAMANQIRTVSKERLGRRLCALPPEVVAQIEEAILLHLGIDR
jgi:mRNA interferase MazF